MLIEVRVDAAEGGEGTETARAVGASLKTRARLEMHNREEGSLKRGWLTSREGGEPGLPVSSGAVVSRLSLRGIVWY